MSVLVVGMSHRTAPVSLLEKVTLGLDERTDVVRSLRTGAVREAVVLATCNRVEVYVDTEEFHAGFEAIREFLQRAADVPEQALTEGTLYVHWQERAVRHLFRVACGLDSMVIGESQILGQLRRAYGASEGGAGRTLHELFQTALRVGKRAHSETTLDEAGQSLVSVGLERAIASVGPLAGRHALVIGAGSMGALAGATLRRAGVASVTVANRTAENAARLATALEGTGIGLAALPEALERADVVVSSTGSTGVVVPTELVRAAVARRNGRPLAILDLALPRDLDPAVRALPGVTLVDLETLQRELASGERGEGVEAARAIVAQEVAAFQTWQRTSRVGPTVSALRSRGAEVVAAELARLDHRLPSLTEHEREEVTRTVRRVVDKVLHQPTVRVRELAKGPAETDYTDALRELFGLDPSAVAAVGAGSEPGPDGALG